MPERGKLWILTGPKGAGKSHLGALLERERGIEFLRVEPIFLEVIAEAGEKSEAVFARGFARVAELVDARLADGGRLVIESTATWPRFGEFLDRVRLRQDVTLIAVRAPLEQCRARVHARDASVHIPVSDPDLARINALAAAVALDWAGVLENGEGTTDAQLLTAWDRIA